MSRPTIDELGFQTVGIKPGKDVCNCWDVGWILYDTREECLVYSFGYLIRVKDVPENTISNKNVRKLYVSIDQKKRIMNDAVIAENNNATSQDRCWMDMFRNTSMPTFFRRDTDTNKISITTQSVVLLGER